MWGDAGDEEIDVGLREAVEEEVRDDEVWFSFGIGWDFNLECGALERGETSGGVGDGAQAAAAKFVEHGGAGVGGDSGALRVAEEELLEETAVAVAEDERVARVVELIEEERAGALQQRAEGEVLAPAVDRGDAIEVGLG